MLSKDLKRLSRRELVDVIYQLKKNEEQLLEEVEVLKQQLEDKRIGLSVAGSIAEASIGITNIFSTAQMTADLYLSEISRLKSETEKSCAKKTLETEERVQKIILESEKQIANLKEHYKTEHQRFKDLEQEIKELEKNKKKLSEE